jgi:hypothetical protein
MDKRETGSFVPATSSLTREGGAGWITSARGNRTHVAPRSTSISSRFAVPERPVNNPQENVPRDARGGAA